MSAAGHPAARGGAPGSGRPATPPAATACDTCLRRAYLLRHLAPRIADLLARRGPRVAGLLALTDADLIAATAGGHADEARRVLDGLDAAALRAGIGRVGVLAACRHSRMYPAGLLDLDDPPAVLFAACRDPRALAVLSAEPSVAIVGTRRPSPYGIEVAQSLGRGLAAAGIHVVSGLALGIDAMAHRGCLDAATHRERSAGPPSDTAAAVGGSPGPGLPVAVLACGPDVAYPRRHRRLHERVRAAGVVLSELPPGTPAFRWSFPARNRIMAGLTRMTLVVEAAEPSGSLITTVFARDAGRSVGAVPGRVTARMARGTNSLLRDGAIPVTCAEDVLDELFGVGVRRTPAPSPAPPPPADPADRAVLAAAEAGGSVDAIARASGLDVSATRAALGRLEAHGHLVRDAFGGWERTAG